MIEEIIKTHPKTDACNEMRVSSKVSDNAMKKLEKQAKEKGMTVKQLVDWAGEVLKRSEEAK